MNSEYSNHASQISLLVQDKLKLLDTLLEKGNQQRQLVDRGESEELLHLLAQKQVLIEDLVQVQSAMDRAFANGKSAFQWNSPEQRQKFQQLAARCNELGQQVLEIEAQCERQAAAQRDSIAQQIQEFSAFDSRNCELNELSGETHLAGFDESS